jgi:hypothetical protein
MKNRAIFLIQLFLWLSLFLTVGVPTANAAMSQAQEIQAVQALEDTLFAVHYDQDSLNDRLSRLETTVFGQPQTGTNPEARLTKLQSSLSPKALGPLSPLSKAAPAQNTANGMNKGNPSQASNGSKPNPTQSYPQTYPTGPAAGAPQPVASSNGPSTYGMGAQNRPNAQPRAAASPTAASPEPGETDYPTVSQMELKEFGKTFPKEDITQRLSRLENQVFKMPQTGSLADRTDNLRMVVLGDLGQGQPTASTYTQPAPNYGYPQAPNYGGGSYNYNPPPQAAYGAPDNYNPPTNYNYGPTASAAMPPNYGGPGAGNINPIPGYGGVNTNSASYQPTDASRGSVPPDMMAAMSEVEKEVLGTTYPAEPLNTRLDRVENKVFKTTSPEMNPQDRIQRVIAVASAGGAPATTKTKMKNTFQTLLPIILTILPLVLL